MALQESFRREFGRTCMLATTSISAPPMWSAPRISVRKFDPSHNPVQYPDFSSLSAAHGPSVARCLTMRCLDNLFLEFLVLCPRARHHKLVTVSEHRHGKCAPNGTDKAKKCPCRIPPLSSKHCAASFVLYVALSRTATHPLLHSSPSHSTLITTVRRAGPEKCALRMSWNPRTFFSAGALRLPVMQRLSMNLRLSSRGVAANVLLASSGVHSLTLLVSCATSLARMNGFAASPLFVWTHLVPMAFNPDLSRCLTALLG